MPLLADFIVATETEALAYGGESAFPASHKSCLSGLSDVELGTLLHIAQGLEVDDEVLYDFRVVRVVDDGACLTIELLPDLVQRLAGAGKTDLEVWSEAWADTEELDCDPEDALEVLLRLQPLARLALAEGKGMYLWNRM